LIVSGLTSNALITGKAPCGARGPRQDRQRHEQADRRTNRTQPPGIPVKFPGRRFWRTGLAGKIFSGS